MTAESLASGFILLLLNVLFLSHFATYQALKFYVYEFIRTRKMFCHHKQITKCSGMSVSMSGERYGKIRHVFRFVEISNYFSRAELHVR